MSFKYESRKLLGYDIGKDDTGVSQIQLGAFRQMSEYNAMPKIAEFLKRAADVNENAIVQIISRADDFEIGLLVDADGNLLEFA